MYRTKREKKQREREKGTKHECETIIVLHQSGKSHSHPRPARELLLRGRETVKVIARTVFYANNCFVIPNRNRKPEGFQTYQQITAALCSTKDTTISKVALPLSVRAPNIRPRYESIMSNQLPSHRHAQNNEKKEKRSVQSHSSVYPSVSYTGFSGASARISLRTILCVST